MPLSLFSGFLTILGSIVIIVGSLIYWPAHRKISDWVLMSWSKYLIWSANVEVEIKGRENIPNEGCLYLFNHLSLYDIPILIYAIRKSIRFGAKAELYKIPFFSMAMRIVGNIKIERFKLEKAIRNINEAVEPLKNGESFILAAEGTRQLEPKIGEFKSGPIILAIQAGAKLVPVVLHGPEKIMHKKQFFINLGYKKKVYVEILPPFDTKGFTLDDRNKIKEIIRQQYLITYAKYNALAARYDS